MADQRTFVAIKPDGVQRGLVGEIVGRFERKGFKLVALKFIKATREQAEAHYDEHKARPFFGELVDFFTSGPVIITVWEGAEVISSVRKAMGVTKPSESAPGTIRGDFAVTVGKNIIHGSDSAESAAREIALWFQPEELVDWSPSGNAWIY
eukprot:CAMPEP_0184665166 /NCGR_PEP_ID=MMETSP0308-20130426/56012_1 /TAXON_ID=38269 /ORGANISM="Gloeochaete witrockiana, Strain SAG 46.84" /LENGTH=150 /DNA_ID=CAMNT_0027108987 /DNA_START=37 /DNA_END=489 /DNA_ORIENTATION=-